MLYIYYILNIIYIYILLYMWANYKKFTNLNSSAINLGMIPLYIHHDSQASGGQALVLKSIHWKNEKQKLCCRMGPPEPSER
jgi:hypothetical protein